MSCACTYKRKYFFFIVVVKNAPEYPTRMRNQMLSPANICNDRKLRNGQHPYPSSTQQAQTLRMFCASTLLQILQAPNTAPLGHATPLLLNMLDKLPHL
mmetsp:Transcript_24953/g.53815  ORF Transcript_24953/g.53815 Transcript_24953/m.53815 type:complete len:99 (-) Transcript_24953:2499-2795(-)